MNDKRQLIRPSLCQLPASCRFTCLLSLPLLVTLLLPACGSLSTVQDGAPDKSLDWESIPDATPQIEPLSKTGNPSSYVVYGQRYQVDRRASQFKQTGIASWYGTKFHGHKTSSGEAYNMYAMTAAHKTLPLPSYVSVTNLENDKTIIVKVNDRGPFVDGRIIDLSYAAAHKLGVVKNGTAEVAIELLASPASNGYSDNPSEVIAFASRTQYFVQLGAFTERENAEDFRSQLAAQSIEPTLIKSFSDSSGDLHKVQVGPLGDVSELEQMESRLSELGYSKRYVITE